MSQISVVLTIYGNDGELDKQLNDLCNQILKPDEVLIVNSEIDYDVNDLLKSYENRLNIKYHFYKERLLPGAARNIGVSISENELIAFLDSKTSPKPNWLSESLQILVSSNAKIVFGNTLYRYSNYFEKILVLGMYGRNIISTVPGTVIYRTTFYQLGEFISDVRAGEDLEWRGRLKAIPQIKIAETNDVNLEYRFASDRKLEQFFRSARNSWSSAKIDAQINTRLLLFGLSVILLILLAPNWNKYIGGILFIPDLTKIILIIISMVLIVTYLRFEDFFFNFMKRFIFPLIFTSILITLINPRLFQGFIPEEFTNDIGYYFLYGMLLIGFFFRAIISPLRLGAKPNEIYPFNWICFGLIGLINDILKLPGYLLGASYFVFKRIKELF